MVDLAGDAQLHSVFETGKLLPKTNQNALGDFVDGFVVATVCKKTMQIISAILL